MFPEPQGVITTFFAGTREIIRPNRIVRIEVKIPEFHYILPLRKQTSARTRGGAQRSRAKESATSALKNETSFPLSYSRTSRMFHAHQSETELLRPLLQEQRSSQPTAPRQPARSWGRAGSYPPPPDAHQRHGNVSPRLTRSARRCRRRRKSATFRGRGRPPARAAVYVRSWLSLDQG